MKRPLAISLIAAGLTILVLGFIPFSFKALDRLVMEQVKTMSQGDSLHVGKISIQLWRGLSLSDITYATQKKKQPKISAQVPGIRLSYKLLPLLHGKVSISSIAVVEPMATVTMPSVPAHVSQERAALLPPVPLPLGKIPLSLPVDIEVNSLKITDALITIKQMTGSKTIAKGLSLSLAMALDTLVSVQGTASIDSLWPFYPYLITDLKTGFVFTPSVLKIENMRFSAYDGKGNVSATIDNGTKTPLNAVIALKKIDIQGLISHVDLGEVRASGTVSLDMAVQGKDLDPYHVYGKGAFSASNVSVSGLPFQKTLATVLFLPALNRLQFDHIKTSLSLAKGIMSTPDLEGTGNVANISGSGWIGLNMHVQEKASISLSPQLCVRLPPIVSKEILTPGPGGRCEAKGELYGPLSKLQINLDKSVKNRAAGAVLKRAGSLLKSFFR